MLRSPWCTVIVDHCSGVGVEQVPTLHERGWVPSFNGEDPVRRLAKVKAFLRIHGTPPVEKMQLAQGCSEGTSSREGLRSLRTTEGQRNSRNQSHRHHLGSHQSHTSTEETMVGGEHGPPPEPPDRNLHTAVVKIQLTQRRLVIPSTPEAARCQSSCNSE